MHNSFRLNFCTVSIMTFLTIYGWISQKNLEHVNIELKETQQHLQQVQNQLKDRMQENQNLHWRLHQKNSEIAIMSICIEGVGRALSDMGDGNRPQAFIELSSVVQECRQADTIAEKTRIEQRETSTVQTHNSLKHINQWTSSTDRQELK
jgi:hypothetical protein